MKTIDEIVCEMLSVADSAEKKHIYDLRELGSDSLRAYVNLIKEAHKKELALAVAAKCEVCDQSVTVCNQQKDWRKICAACQEGEYPEDCEYFGEPGGCNAPTMGKHPTCKDSLQVGNAAKMREAVAETEKSIDKAISILEEIPETCGFAGLLEDACDVLCYLKEEFVKPALSSTARNCDMYKSEPEAYQAYLTAMKNATKKTYVYFEPWLFAEAKGEME